MDRMPGEQSLETEAAFVETIADAVVLAGDFVELRICQAAIHHLRRSINRQSLTEMVRIRAAELEIQLC